MRLLLARHGETGEQYAGRYVGATDLPLSGLGRDQARRLADVLPGRGGRCLCSPMRRAQETATLALAGRDYPLAMVDALREIDFGRWEGLSFAEIADLDQDLVDQWRHKPESFRFPGGECIADFRQRVLEVTHWITTLPDEEVLVICHGGVIRVMLCSLLGLSFDRYLSFAIVPAALTTIEMDGQYGVLTGLNLTAGTQGGQR